MSENKTPPRFSRAFETLAKFVGDEARNAGEVEKVEKGVKGGSGT